MKKVIANWLKKSEVTDYVSASSLNNLGENYDYIGFTPSENADKYMLVCIQGDWFAVRPDGWFSSNQKECEGEYFIFDSANELLKWMQE
jgi:hypothetical protein